MSESQDASLVHTAHDEDNAHADIGHVSRCGCTRWSVLSCHYRGLAASVCSGARLDLLLILPELKSLHDALNGQTASSMIHLCLTWSVTLPVSQA